MSSANLVKLTITEILSGLTSKKFSAVELVNAYLDQITKFQDLNAYITVTEEIARKAAKETDERIASGTMRKLEGLPLAIKDSFCTKDVLTTAGSKILQDFVPPYESTVTNKLKQVGSIMLGKANCDEFAMGSSNLTSCFGSVINPWRSSKTPELPLVPGGSSGGSSAAVAAFMAAAALGTDTGGSVRQPASFTGTVGVKPTYGRCSRLGIVAFASSLDQAGIITRNVEDAALMLENMMGFDPQDSTSVNLEVPQLSTAVKGQIRGLRIGIPTNLFKNNALSSEISQVWQRTAKLLAETEGATIVDINLPNIDYALPTYYIIAPAEASANLARYDGIRYGLRAEQPRMSLEQMYESTRDYGFGNEVKRRIMIGNYVLSSGFIDAYYIKAQKVRRLIANDFHSAFNNVDVILMPTTPSAAFPLNVTQDDPTTMYLNDIFTIPPSLAGLPAISIPAALSAENLPLGMQIISKAFDEYTMFKVAAALERAINIKFIPGGF